MTTTITISAGVVSSGLTLSNGVQLSVLPGGEVDATVISSGGSADISGVASGTVVLSGGASVRPSIDTRFRLGIRRSICTADTLNSCHASGARNKCGESASTASKWAERIVG